MKNHQTEIWATDCPLAAIQFKQHAGLKPKHPMTILDFQIPQNQTK